MNKDKKEEHPRKYEMVAVNVGRYAMPGGKISAACQNRNCSKCFALSCSCECHN